MAALQATRQIDNSRRGISIPGQRAMDDELGTSPGKLLLADGRYAHAGRWHLAGQFTVSSAQPKGTG